MTKVHIFRHTASCLLALALVPAGCSKENENPNLQSVRIEQLTFKPVPTVGDVEKTSGLARTVLDSIQAGADFETMARRYSTHSSAARSGVLVLTPGWMPEGFDDSVDVLADGAMSGLIRTPVALYIVKRDSSEFLSVRTSHILIMADTTRAWISKEQSWKEAEDKSWELYRRALAGESFYDLAKEFSQDTKTAEEGGDLGWTKRNTLVREYENMAFSQPEGAISQPVKSRYGFHVIRTVKKKDLNLFLRIIEFKPPVNGEDLSRARKVADQARGMAQGGQTLEEIQSELEGATDAEVSYSKPYEVRKRMLLPQIAKLVEDLDEGDVSDVLSGENGYYFIKLVKK